MALLLIAGLSVTHNMTIALDYVAIHAKTLSELCIDALNIF